jgi:hypothetical protein
LKGVLSVIYPNGDTYSGQIKDGVNKNIVMLDDLLLYRNARDSAFILIQTQTFTKVNGARTTNMASVSKHTLLASIEASLEMV